MSVAAITEQRFAVTAFAMLAAVVYLATARAHCGQSVAARYGVGVLGFAIAALVVLGHIVPVVAYAVLCLSMVAVYVVDLVQEEHARRRRVASLAPRPRVDRTPAIWTVVATLSAAMVIPYSFEEGNRVAASLVGACAVAMAAIAWRIASAPVQLLGNDPEAERKADRALRTTKTGITAVLAVGSVFVFATFANQASGAVTPVERAVSSLAFYAWVGLCAWVSLYVFLDRRSARVP